MAKAKSYRRRFAAPVSGGRPLPRLLAGDTVAVAAPAGPFDPVAFRRGVAVLESLGFRVKVPPPVFDRCGYLAGSDRRRAGLLNRLFTDPEVAGIICARGGYGSLRVLPYLDFERIRKHPKVFCGFSDITALHWALYAFGGLATFHGPVVISLSRAAPEAVRALKGAWTNGPPPVLRAPGAVCLRPGRARGPLVGGNLATLCHLIGTPWEPRFYGRILLIEDVNEAPYRIDRMLTQLKMAGCLRGVLGVVLGAFEDCGSTAEVYRIVTEIFSRPTAPILAGLEVGHVGLNRTIPLGVVARLDAEAGELRFGHDDVRDV